MALINSIEIPTYAYNNGGAITPAAGFPVPDYNVVPINGWIARRYVTPVTGNSSTVTPGAEVVIINSNNTIAGNSSWITNITPTAIKALTNA